MDNFLILVAGILIIAGIIGCFYSKFPGTPVSFLGIIILNYSSIATFPTHIFIRYGLLVIAVQGLDYLIPSWGNKKFGGSVFGVWGSLLGLLIGLSFGITGISIGAFAGAFVGEYFAGKESNEAIHHAVSSFAFFILGTIFQLIVCGLFLYQYIENVKYIIF